MATAIRAEENWQSVRKTIRERNKFMFNKPLLSDVEFLPSGATKESDRIKETTIPAHKYVLAIGSPVFFAMFYGQLAETADTIKLPDCDSESLLELLRYLYCDEVELTGSNVMQVLYLANKYVVPSLAALCTEFLQSNLSAENVFDVLPSALKLEDKILANKCWEIIDDEGSQAVKSEPFKNIDKALLASVLERSTIDCPEVDLFEAMMDWASNECKQRECEDTGEEKRNVLGEEVLYLCRYPLMTLNQFVRTVLKADVLNKKEIVEMFRYYGKDPIENFCFSLIPRESPAFNIYRFQEYSGSWGYGGKKDCLSLSVDKPIKIHGVTLFGSNDSNYTVELWIKETSSLSQLFYKKDSFRSVLIEGVYQGYDVCFDEPVRLSAHQIYTIEALIEGPQSQAGSMGNETLLSEGVTFRFSKEKSSNSTSAFAGQFPRIRFSKRVCP